MLVSSYLELYVDLQRDVTQVGCGVELGLIYAAIPRVNRYSTGLGDPSEILIRFLLYQRI